MPRVSGGCDILHMRHRVLFQGAVFFGLVGDVMAPC